MDSRKLRERFEIIDSLRTDSSHPTIDIVRKKKPRGQTGTKYSYFWFMKREPKSSIPTKEVIGQEFFRLLIPYQPKTRLLVDNDMYGSRHKYYVISKEIPKFKKFHELNHAVLKKKLLNGTYKGLGDILVASLFLREDDLHSGNIGVDEQGRVVKIDGGFTLESKKTVTEKDIAALPKLNKTYPKNWIGMSVWSRELEKSIINTDNEFANAMREESDFRREINRMLLRISVLPEELIQKFIQSYEPTSAEEAVIANIIKQSQLEIRSAANNNPDFLSYLYSADAKEDLNEYLDYLDTFKTTGKHFLMRDDKSDVDFREMIENQLKLQIKTLYLG